MLTALISCTPGAKWLSSSGGTHGPGSGVSSLGESCLAPEQSPGSGTAAGMQFRKTQLICIL